MWVMRVRSVLSLLLLSAAAALGSTGSAQAATYTGHYDPAYGGIFPQLGWEASALFDVPDACLAIGNGTNIPISGPCAGFDILSAQVSFYNVANPGAILNSYALDPNVIVNGINIAGGHLAGIDTGFFDSFVSALPIAGNGQYAFSLILFAGNQAQLIFANPPQTSPGCAFLSVPGASCGISANAATGVFAPVSEPATLLLMLAGLGAIGLGVRARRS
jgi:PEP-CTERM motif